MQIRKCMHSNAGLGLKGDGIISSWFKMHCKKSIQSAKFLQCFAEQRLGSLIMINSWFQAISFFFHFANYFLRNCWPSWCIKDAIPSSSFYNPLVSIGHNSTKKQLRYKGFRRGDKLFLVKKFPMNYKWDGPNISIFREKIRRASLNFNSRTTRPWKKKMKTGRPV